MNIRDLVKKYKSNRDYYLSTKYNETQLRNDFLDMFFELLGWDITNKENKSTNEREVLLEEPLKNEALANTKKPDYTFRLFSERKFFLEAKKPSINIKDDSKSAKQIRRYGFTAKLKISVLSNFEYLAIYDCSHKVEHEDISTKARVQLYHYKDYESNFNKIKEQLGKANVYSGNFEKTWEHIEEKLKRFSVDKLFIKQINEWRLILGREVYQHKQDLTNDQLNDIVQSYINSIIFLRVCEDRELEGYKTLLNLANQKNYQALIEKFKQADNKYNAGLFKHPLTEEIISNNYSAFWVFIKQLYYPGSTYSFAVFASDILGNIYEIFLGEQLTIQNNNVVLMKKPENIDRDIVTTPTFIVQAILKNTVMEYCKNKTDQYILNSKFADIACGSGVFLLEAYQLINDILIDYYLKNKPNVLIRTSINTLRLPLKIKRKILENCIYGIDKDYNAVQACKFGLLLKLLEDENNETIAIPALPDLSKNIQFGNSLLNSNQIKTENIRVINPYDFNESKYDVIIGNPPYMATEHMKNLTPLELPLYKKNYSAAFKQFDKYYLFIEQGLKLLSKEGILGYIVPSKFTKVGAGKELRKLLKNNQSIEQIISFGVNQIFTDKTTYTCMLILKKNKQKNVKYIEINSLIDWKTRKPEAIIFDEIEYNKLNNDGWGLVPNYLKNVFQKINSQSSTLSDLIGENNIFNGIQTSANKIFIHSKTKSDKRYYYFTYDKKKWKIEKFLTRPYYKTSKGIDNLNTYRPFSPNAFVIYPYNKTKKGIEFINIKLLKTKYPFAYEFLLYNKDKLSKTTRDIKPTPISSDEWYRYGRHQSLDKCDVPEKIIVGVLSQGNKYAIDYYGTLISSGGTAGYCIITLPEKCKYSIFYIQALLNSKYLEWYSTLIGEVFRGGYIARGTKVLKKMPIRIIDFNNKIDVKLYNKIIEIQKILIKTQSDIDANIDDQRALIPLKRYFERKAIELDNTFTNLYNLGVDDDLIPLISEIYATN